MAKGKIVLVPFPFDDFSSLKVRPAVCLTEKVGVHEHIVVAFITSQRPNPMASSDLLIETSHADFALTELRVTSTVRLHRLTTVTASSILRELGSLSDELLKLVNETLIEMLRLNEGQ